MKNSFRLSFISALFLLFSTITAFGQAGLVISQIYGGGGNSGAQYTNDFIELYNPTATATSTSGLSVQYASSTGTSWNTFPLPASSIAPGHYYLIQAAAGTGTDAALPTPDATIPTSQTFNLSATTGKVALVNSTTALTGACPLPNANVLDFIGYGTANCFEGAVAPAPSNTLADVRANPPTDTNNNSTDFSTAAPNPRNSTFGGSSAALSATGAANPASVIAGQTTVLTVTVTPATSPASTNIAVTGDLRLIGGSQTQAFTDNGRQHLLLHRHRHHHCLRSHLPSRHRHRRPEQLRLRTHHPHRRPARSHRRHPRHPGRQVHHRRHRLSLRWTKSHDHRRRHRRPLQRLLHSVPIARQQSPHP